MNYLVHKSKFSLVLLLILTINLMLILPLHGQQFNRYINEQVFPSETELNSYKTTLQNEYKEAVKDNDATKKIESLVLLSTLERSSLNYGASFDKSGEALFMAEELGNDLLLAKAHEEFGVINFLFKRDETAGLHFREAHNYYKKAFRNKQITSSTLYRSYYNQLLYYQRIVDEKKTQVYIDSCYNLANSAELDDIYNVYLNEKKAFLLIRENKLNEALQLLDYSAKTLENLHKETETAQIHKSFLIIVYSVIGRIYVLQDKNELARIYYQKSIDTKDLYGENTFYTAYVYAKYAELLSDMGEFEESYIKLLKSKGINDEYLNARSESTHGFLSVRDRYAEELTKKNEELNHKDLELAENKQEILRFRILFFVGVFLIIVVALVVRSRIQNIKHEKEKDRNRIKEQKAKELLDHKNKELTTTMLQLIEKEEIIKTLSQHLEKFKDDSSTRSLLTSINKRSESLWEAFNNRFIALNEDFYDRLKANIPDLSSNELKICALIKLNFSGKEMAYLLGISPGSVNVARHRLRKKMDIDRDTNLSKFINSI